jgi:hypothetical protein
MLEKVQADTRRILYEKGGRLLNPYGYYHPSIILPKVDRSFSRGRLYHEQLADYSYEYQAHLLAGTVG